METTQERLTPRQGARSLRVLALVVGLLAGAAAVGVSGPGLLGGGAPVLAGAQDDATPVAMADANGADCPAELHGEGAEPWVRAELYFGTTRPDGPEVSEKEWLAFLDTEVTPRFPAGLTVLTGLGQFQRDDGTILQERSEVLIILYPAEGAAESSAMLEEIRDEYEQQFEQSSVLRADTTAVCTSF